MIPDPPEPLGTILSILLLITYGVAILWGKCKVFFTRYFTAVKFSLTKVTFSGKMG